MQKLDELTSKILAEESHLRRFARSLCNDRDTADDMVQQTLIAAWQSRNTYHQTSGLRAWLYVILRNKYFSAHRRTKREVPDPDMKHASQLAVPDVAGATLDQERLTDHVERSLERLPNRMRRALVGHCVNGRTYEELADELKCPLGTVRSSIFRARDEMRRLAGAERLEVLSESIDGDAIAIDSDSDSATGSDSTLSLS